MAVKTRERTSDDRRSIRQTLTTGPQGTHSVRWVATLATILVATCIGIGFLVISQGDEPGKPATVTLYGEPQVGTQEFLNRLANLGYIPGEAVDEQRLLLERLVNRGLVPKEALVEPDGTANANREELIERWVRQGVVPRQTLD